MMINYYRRETELEWDSWNLRGGGEGEGRREQREWRGIEEWTWRRWRSGERKRHVVHHWCRRCLPLGFLGRPPPSMDFNKDLNYYFFCRIYFVYGFLVRAWSWRLKAEGWSWIAEGWKRKRSFRSYPKRNLSSLFWSDASASVLIFYYLWVFGHNFDRKYCRVNLHFNPIDYSMFYFHPYYLKSFNFSSYP